MATRALIAAEESVKDSAEPAIGRAKLKLMDINIWADLSSSEPAGSVRKLAGVGVEAAAAKEWED